LKKSTNSSAKRLPDEKPARPPPSEPAKVDDLLVKRFCAGELGAFQVLVVKYQRGIAAQINRSVRNDSVAEELTQETFLHAYRGLPKFRFESAFSTWLYTIARNIATLYHRDGRGKADRSVSLDELNETFSPTDTAIRNGSSASPEDDMGAKQLLAGIQVVIDELPPRVREALLLRELQDLSYLEIATQLDVPLNTAKSLVFRARATIAAEIRPLLDKVVMGGYVVK
jgi:RNA polymerase sigma-70 factor, ECF subfamily